MTVAATFEIRFTRYLDPTGREAAPLPSFAADARALLPDYRAMVFMRALDAKAIAMQRTGQIGTYASTLGKEAIDAGIGAVLAPNDVLLPSYRESGILMLRGVSPHRTLLYWGGDERGNVFPESPHDFPFNVPIASQMPHAAGVAYAMKLRREPRVALAMCGDGATSKGDFYEAINAAGAWKLPMVVVVVNNQYAISVPRRMQSAAQTLAQKAIAAGIACEQVDGNDLIAVRDAVGRAVELARTGRGPTLLEALTYRLSDHTTADDATRYRSADELKEQWKEEPILRLRSWLHAKGAWSPTDEQALAKDAQMHVQKMVQAYLDTPPPGSEQMFEHLYARLPRQYQSQVAELTQQEERDVEHHAG
ncbi:MAG: pyruvate dehydrogenase (acetyl-transferring) E1 component subunit alpha [Betaproteobacteria bacterium]|nr:pyruvate dehydrogenase (acetyl-transferring) E1 component subunit alpha [Betaproteobacteria bacterium]